MMAGCSTGPYPRTVGDEPEEHPWPGSPFSGEALAVNFAEIAPGDGALGTLDPNHYAVGDMEHDRPLAPADEVGD
jgi:hypothetical protein